MRTSPSALEVLTCLPPLDLVVQGKVRTAAHRLWSLGCWSYLHPNGGYSNILMRLQKSDPIFSMGNDIMRPIYNFDIRYKVNMLNREEWTKGTWIPSCNKVARLVYRWVQDTGGGGDRGPESMGSPRGGGSVCL